MLKKTNLIDIYLDQRPNTYVKEINGITFIDAIALESSIDRSLPPKYHFQQKMINAGVWFWNDSHTIVKKPVIGISTFNGFQICLAGEMPEDTIKLRHGDTLTAPMKIESLSELYNQTINNQHYSVAHAATLGFTCLGLSKKAAIEFKVQRDLVHLVGETSARSACQDAPTLVAMTEQGAKLAENILKTILEEIAKFESLDNHSDWSEECNALLPLSASVSLGINGDLKNFLKLVAAINDEGKELEYRNALALINDSLSALFPELFKPTPAYGYVYPNSWSALKPISRTSKSAAESLDKMRRGENALKLKNETKHLSDSEDKIFQVSNSELVCRSNPASTSFRVVVITNNKHKFEEFRAQLGDGYGMDVQQWKTSDNEALSDDSLIQICEEIMVKQPFSPHFVVREETSLISQKNGDDLTNLSIEELKNRHLEPVLHQSTLKVVKPQWLNKEAGNEHKNLKEFSLRMYVKRSRGYITREKTNLDCAHGFGWDAIFVNAATNLTNEDFFDLYGKKSARQHTISDFIESYLRYKALTSLKYHQLPISRPIDFGARYVHLSRFVQNEQYLSNPHIADWGIEHLRNAMLNEGLFIKAAWTRPVKNYFSPPFSGLPLTAKATEAEETIFMTHDMLHHLICDLICDLESTKENFYVYSAWRMASEACTLVLADMLYADGLVKSGVSRSCVDSRIYPLFECIIRVQKFNTPSLTDKNANIKFIQKLLFANVIYALLGDDSEWVKLLTSENGIPDEGSLGCLNAYNDHFGKFFIGDNAWTRANFDNMQQQVKPLREWINNVGKEQFRKAKIPLLSDILAQISPDCKDIKNYKEVVNSVFNFIFENKIKPHLLKEKVMLDQDEILQSRAFRRFLIGQVSLFARFPTPLNLEYIQEEILARIKDDRIFSLDEQDEIRLKMEQYIRGIQGLQLMSMNEANNAIDCSPVFPPVYISYSQMQKKYDSIANCVRLCVESYEDKKSTPFIPSSYGLSNDIIFAQKKEKIPIEIAENLRKNSLMNDLC